MSAFPTPFEVDSEANLRPSIGHFFAKCKLYNLFVSYIITLCL